MEQTRVWEIIVEHSDLIGAVVHKTLQRYSAAASDADREDYKSFAIELLADGRMAKWKPGGKSIKSWVAMVAEQATIRELKKRTKRKRTVSINANDVEGPESRCGVTLYSPDDTHMSVAKQQQHERLMKARERLSNADRELLDAIVEDRVKELELTAGRLHQRRKRLIQQMQQLVK